MFSTLRAASAASVLAAAGAFLTSCGRGPAVRKPVAPQATQQEEMAKLPGPGFQPPPPGSYELAPIQRAADGDVLDADGTRRRLSSYLGDRLVLLSFIYTRCTDGRGCPFATAVFHLIEREIASRPDLDGQVRLVTLSFDPSHDTAAVMLRYAGDGYLDQSWHERRWAFLTTNSSRDLQPILDGYGQSVAPEIDENGDLTSRFSHVLKVFLIDRERRVRNIYSTAFLHPVVVVNDLETLRREEPRSSPAS